MLESQTAMNRGKFFSRSRPRFLLSSVIGGKTEDNKNLGRDREKNFWQFLS